MNKIFHISYGLRLPLVLVAIILLTSCDKGVSVEGSPQILATKNETVKKLQFTLSDSASVTVRLKNLVSDKELVFNNLPEKLSHEVLLAGLKPNQNYALNILKKKKVLVQIDSFRTNAISENIVNIFERTNTPNAFTGHLLTQRRLIRGSVYMVDNESDLVWYQMTPGQPKLSKWTAHNEVLVLVGNASHNNSAGDRIMAYTVDGNISYDIDLKPLNLVAHHELVDRDNSVYALVYDTIPNMVNGKLEKAVSSAVVKLNKKGEVTWKWSTFDVKNPKDISIDAMDGDWGHANALAFDDDGNLLISYRDWSQIWKINRDTGKRMWILGEDGDFKLNDTPFNRQHAIHKNLSGDYMLFDNGKALRQTRVMSYKLVDSIATPEVSITLPEDLYADKMGNVEELPNGNFLICSPRSRSIVVINPDGDILYHINTGIPDPYRATYVPSFFTTQ